ncbi:MAG: AmmeMemoRadiSam system protein A [Campylobacterota bacterium]|nr:AmmeMemoRadiSam system protein A [Campylobacterota bacterium]
MEDKKILLKIARTAIQEKLDDRFILDRVALIKEHPWLRSDGAVFVTINKRAKLRGCIGSLQAHRDILEDTASNAISAAFHDPRFEPLSKEEFKEIEIEISILTEPKLIKYKDVADLKKIIRPNIDGVVLKYGNARATFLPLVWESLPKFDEFFGHLCQKAGLTSDCLKHHPEIYLYQAEKIKE